MTEASKKTALIAMSGGVDSSVCALIAQAQGYECVGVTMKLFENSDISMASEKTCCSIEDAHLAAGVCASLGMNHYIWDFSEDFRRDVIERFVSAYEQGFTPNPCIDCNRYLKYDRLFKRAMQMGFSKLATGHYARIEFSPMLDRYVLKKAKFLEKDQSYVLYAMNQEQLSKTIFPIGDLTKSEVRLKAGEHGFSNANKGESQDICFVRDEDYKSFIRRYRGRNYPSGNFVLEDGTVVGKHSGIINYTIGQRRGLGIALGERMFVKEIDAHKNEVVLAKDEDIYLLECDIKDVFMNIPEYLGEDGLTAKLRYLHKPADVVVKSISKSSCKLIFGVPQRAISKGQAAVIYKGDIVVGGGTIC